MTITTDKIEQTRKKKKPGIDRTNEGKDELKELEGQEVAVPAT
jgi:hypothetical protein